MSQPQMIAIDGPTLLYTSHGSHNSSISSIGSATVYSIIEEGPSMHSFSNLYQQKCSKISKTNPIQSPINPQDTTIPIRPRTKDTDIKHRITAFEYRMRKFSYYTRNYNSFLLRQSPMKNSINFYSSQQGNVPPIL